MRLIDADEFKKEIAAVAISRNLNVKLANMLCKIIDSQPTACDMDKAVEKMLSESLCAAADDENRSLCLTKQSKSQSQAV